LVVSKPINYLASYLDRESPLQRPWK